MIIMRQNYQSSKFPLYCSFLFQNVEIILILFLWLIYLGKNGNPYEHSSSSISVTRILGICLRHYLSSHALFDVSCSYRHVFYDNYLDLFLQMLKGPKSKKRQHLEWGTWSTYGISYCGQKLGWDHTHCHLRTLRT